MNVDNGNSEKFVISVCTYRHVPFLSFSEDFPVTKTDPTGGLSNDAIVVMQNTN